MLASEVVVVEQTTKGAIIRIDVRGKWTDGRAEELAKLVAVALSDHDPYAFVIDLRETKGFLLADTLGALFPHFFRKRANVACAACVVATGSTARAFRWALEISKVSQAADVTLFADVESAMDHLRRREDPRIA